VIAVVDTRVGIGLLPRPRFAGAVGSHRPLCPRAINRSRARRHLKQPLRDASRQGLASAPSASRLP
jgi:hypothetical protein